MNKLLNIVHVLLHKKQQKQTYGLESEIKMLVLDLYYVFHSKENLYILRKKEKYLGSSEHCYELL